MPTVGNSGWCFSMCLLRLLLACFYFKVNVLLFMTAHAVQTAREGWGGRKEALTALTKDARSQDHAVPVQRAPPRGLT